jgi:DNA polymerase-1
MGMEEAYQREQRLMPILSESTRQGMPVDMEALARDIEIYMAARKISEDYIYSKLGVFEISKDAQLAAALDKAGLVTEWVMTATGKRSTSRKNLQGRVKDPELMAHLAYHGILTTCLGTFAGPWLTQALAEEGRLHPQWNQVKGNYGTANDAGGAKTGRMSCWEPNLQNVPNDFEGVIVPALVEKFFSTHWPTLPRIMHMRRYLLPGEGRIWLKRDFSAQEMRIMSHYAEGQLYQWYLDDPDTDPHEMVSQMMFEKLGIHLKRKPLKIIAFGIMYGRGLDNLAAALGVTKEQAKTFRDAYYSLLPEVRELSNQCKRRGQNGEFIRTWGGRCYHREPSVERDFSYRLMNYLIQGGAADQTKQSIIDWHAEKLPSDQLLAAVHDENNISALIDSKAKSMEILKIAMNADRFDAPFRSEGFAGPNWGAIEKYEPEVELT